jgi:hypothetical protein
VDKLEKIQLFRERFYGRQDVYGVKITSMDKASGVARMSYSPQCSNFWKENICSIRTKDGRTCGTCLSKAYSPLSDEAIWKHIKVTTKFLATL